MSAKSKTAVPRSGVRVPTARRRQATQLADAFEKVGTPEQQAKNLLKLKIAYYSRQSVESPVPETRERCKRELEKLATDAADFTRRN